MSRFAHILFLFTALAPMSAVFGLNRILAHKRETSVADVAPIVISIGLVIACKALLGFTIRRIESQNLTFRSAKSIDQDVLPFLVAYVLPLATNNTVLLTGNFFTVVLVIVMGLTLAIRGNLSVVNPVVAFLGYRFYEIQSDNGMVFVLLTRKPILSAIHPLSANHLFDVVFVSSEVTQ